MRKDKEEFTVNYSYLNKDLELISKVPASVLFYWLPFLIFMNWQTFIVASALTFFSIYLHSIGFSLIEFKEIFGYIIRNPKLKIDKEEK